MSHLTQMSGLAVQNFVSAAVGLAVAVALVRGLVRRRSETIGNFWVDLTRSVTRVLLPLSVVFALVLAGNGVVQNFSGGTETSAGQVIPGGPVASQEAIKELGTNGGGFYNANSAHPFENPNGFTNLLEIWLLLMIPFALPYAFGRLAGDRRQGWAVFAAMFTLWIASAGLAIGFEQAGNPNIDASRRQHGGQGGAVRHRRLRALRRVDDRHLDGRGQRRPRQLHAARRRRPARQHDARRGDARRRRRGPVRDADLRAPRRLPRRPDGRADPGVPRQEDPGGRDEARRPLHPDRAHARARLLRRLRRSRPGQGVDPQPGAARALGDRLRLHVGVEQQRLGLRRPDRQHRLVQHDARAGDARRPLPADRDRARDRRHARAQAARPGDRRHLPDRHAALRRAAASPSS